MSSKGLSSFAGRETEAHRAKVSTVRWNCNGRKLATGSPDASIRIWSVENTVPGKDRRDGELKLSQEPADLAWHPQQADQLVSASQVEKSLKLWDVRSSKSTGSINTNSFNMFVAWNPADTAVIAVVSRANVVSFVDTRTMAVSQSVKSSSEVNMMAFSRDGSLFFQTTGRGGVEVHSYPQMELLHTLLGHTATVYSLDVSANERLLATGGADGLVSLWDLDSITCERAYIGCDHPVRTVSFSQDSRYLAYAADSTPTITIESLGTSEPPFRLNTVSPVESLAWNPKHNVLAYAGPTSGSYGTFGVFAPQARAARAAR